MQPLSLLGVVVGIALGTYSAATPALDLTAGAGAAHYCPDANYGIAFNASAIAFLEPGPVVKVEDYGGGHYAPSGGSNTGIGIGYSELTGNVADFCVGTLFRAEYRAEASRDLLDVLVANHFGKPFDAGRTYDLWMSEYSFKAAGIRLRRLIEFELSDQWSSRLGVSASLLKATEGQEDRLSGNVTATSSTYAVGAGTWLQTASNLSLANFNPFVAPGRPGAYGYSTDVEWVATSKAGWSVDVTAIDALGRLYWKEVPRSRKTLNNSDISYNANFDRQAFISGIDSRIGYTQNLVPKYQLAMDTPQAFGLSGHAEDDFVEGLHFPSLGARYGVGDNFAELSFDIRTKAVGVGGRLDWIRALVTTNNLRIRSATVVGLSIQAIHDW
jgi:hypothetical protein